jgi:hypothetical protein
MQQVTPKHPNMFGRFASVVADRFKHRPENPHSPQPPGVDQSAWARNVEQKRVSPNMTVHDVGLSVYGETRSFSDDPGSNESIHTAREKVAHVILNGVAQRGVKHPSAHDPVEPTEATLRNPAERAAYESSLRAAKEAYLSGTDPTHGAIYFRLLGTADRLGLYNGRSQLRTQSGPYRNSFQAGDVRANKAWITTYGPEKEH